MTRIKGHRKKGFKGNRGRLVFNAGHISLSSAKKWIKQIGQDSKQKVFGIDGSYGVLEIRTTGDPALVLLSIHKNIDLYNELWLRANSQFQVFEPPKPPKLENRSLLRKLEIHRNKLATT